MTHEAKVNLGELFNQKIKQQPINSVKTRKIHQGNGKKKYGQSGIIGVAKVDSPNYSQGYFFVLKYRNDEKINKINSVLETLNKNFNDMSRNQENK